MSVNGDANTGPMRLGTAIVDMGTGLYSAIGILMALHERERSGHGQYLDMTLYDCGMALLHPQAANFFLNGKRPAGTGNPHPNLVPYDKFPTRTCDIFIAVRQQRAVPQAWRRSSAGRNWRTIRASPTTASAMSIVPR